MEFLGLGGLLGLLGFLGKSGINEKVEEFKSDIAKSNEQVENRIKNIEKIAADANRKAQDASNDNQHFATKIDTENLSKRITAVESSGDNAKISELESKLEILQSRLEEVLKINSALQQRIDNLEDKQFDESIQNLADNFKTFEEDAKSFDGNFQVIDERLKIFDGNFKAVVSNLQSFDERIKTLEDRPATSEDGDKNFEDRLGVVEEEYADFTKKVEDFNAVIQKHHVALVQWKNNFLAIQNSFNAVQSNFDENKKVFIAMQSRLDAQEKLFEELKSKLDSQDGLKDLQQNFDENKQSLTAIQSHIDEQGIILDDFKTKFDAQDSLINSFQQNFDDNKQSLTAIQSRLDEQGIILDDFKTKFAAQGSLLDSFQKNIAEFEKVFESLKEDAYLTIENFDIKPTGRIFFTNKPDEVFKNLKIASNLSGITSFLESSNFDKKESFIRIIENYRQNLKKVTDKVRRKKFNEDALSEEVTEAFFNTLSKFFLATIPISIYRGARQETLESLDENIQEGEFKFYSAFLTKINEYLAACQVYTVPVLPKTTMTSEDIDRMSVTRKETLTESEDNLIDEVERLPYYMDYLTEGGEVENFCSEGKMVVLKFDGGAQ